VVLDDAATNVQFGKDPHIAATRGRSILCFPLAGQTVRKGVVYLENRLTEGAFTPGRIKILQLLSTQAVISMENAELYATLEKKVNERTRLLQERNRELATTLGQLRETQDRLLMQDRLAALGALTAGIAHELRNPLNFVNNFAELSVELVAEVAEGLAAGGPSGQGNLQDTLEELRGHLAKVEQHGRRMEGIIRSMLDHSRGDRGEVEEIDFNALVHTYVNIGYQAARARGAVENMALDFALDASIGPVFVVPQEISRVVVNLIDNACYAVTEKAQAATTPSYSPTILIRTRRLPGDAIELRIRDNGPGIRGDAKSRLFDPFFTTKPPGKGTGLGLSLSHDIIVRGYGGSLALETREGEFAEFIVTIPRRRR
jgi:signal transduction histidine kinase